MVPERHARQWMVRVDDDDVVAHLDDVHRDLLALGGLGNELVADLHLFRVGELGTVDLQDERLVILAVARLGRNDDLTLVARLETGERRLQTRHNHPVPVDVLDGLPAFPLACVEQVALVVAKLVVDDDVRIGLDGGLVHGLRKN